MSKSLSSRKIPFLLVLLSILCLIGFILGSILTVMVYTDIAAVPNVDIRKDLILDLGGVMILPQMASIGCTVAASQALLFHRRIRRGKYRWRFSGVIMACTYITTAGLFTAYQLIIVNDWWSSSIMAYYGSIAASVVGAFVLIILFIVLARFREPDPSTRSTRPLYVMWGITATGRLASKQMQETISDGSEAECIVCKNPIEKGETIITCPNCDGSAHRTHMEDWLLKNETCPLCKHKLR